MGLGKIDLAHSPRVPRVTLAPQARAILRQVACKAVTLWNLVGLRAGSTDFRFSSPTSAGWQTHKPSRIGPQRIGRVRS